jgi:hypothetical protein
VDEYRRAGDGPGHRPAQRRQLQVSGAIPVTFADYTIPNPSFGPVTTEDHGEIEFLLAFTRT